MSNLSNTLFSIVHLWRAGKDPSGLDLTTLALAGYPRSLQHFLPGVLSATFQPFTAGSSGHNSPYNICYITSSGPKLKPKWPKSLIYRLFMFTLADTNPWQSRFEMRRLLTSPVRINIFWSSGNWNVVIHNLFRNNNNEELRNFLFVNVLTLSSCSRSQSVNRKWKYWIE